jgi:hypothetical protein
MRNCDSEEDAGQKFASLIVNNPDETTVHMESWEIVDVVDTQDMVNGFSYCATEEEAEELADELNGLCDPHSSFWIDSKETNRIMARATLQDWNDLDLDCDFTRI